MPFEERRLLGVNEHRKKAFNKEINAAHSAAQIDEASSREPPEFTRVNEDGETAMTTKPITAARSAKAQVMQEVYSTVTDFAKLRG